MQFEWDPKKAAINLRDHRVSFEEASTALEDELSLTGDARIIPSLRRA